MSDENVYTIEAGFSECRKEPGLFVRSVNGMSFVPSDTTITSRSDSWRITGEVCEALKMKCPRWVEHDKKIIWFGY